MPSQHRRNGPGGRVANYHHLSSAGKKFLDKMNTEEALAAPAPKKSKAAERFGRAWPQVQAGAREPAMATLMQDPDQINSVLAYMKSLVDGGHPHSGRIAALARELEQRRDAKKTKAARDAKKAREMAAAAAAVTVKAPSGDPPAAGAAICYAGPTATEVLVKENLDLCWGGFGGKGKKK